MVLTSFILPDCGTISYPVLAGLSTATGFLGGGAWVLRTTRNPPLVVVGTFLATFTSLVVGDDVSIANRRLRSRNDSLWPLTISLTPRMRQPFQLGHCLTRVADRRSARGSTARISSTTAVQTKDSSSGCTKPGRQRKHRHCRCLLARCGRLLSWLLQRSELFLERTARGKVSRQFRRQHHVSWLN